MHGSIKRSLFTQSVVDLVRQIQDSSPLKNSLFEQAKAYFDNADKEQANLEYLRGEVDLKLNANAKRKPKKDSPQAKALKQAELALKREISRQEDERLNRLHNFNSVCEQIVLLCEGETWESTQTSSAKVLGTLQLLFTGEGQRVIQEGQVLKPAYKSVISLRLLDKLLNDNDIKHDYINSRYQLDARYAEKANSLTSFQKEVAMPVVMACLLQDIGLLHSDAQTLLKGEKGDLDEYRVLDKEDRLELLKQNHINTMAYLTQGLGADNYRGNSREERTEFNASETARIKFIVALLKGALQPKLGIGNLIRVPQIYASFIFSTKKSYDFFSLPKAGLLINKTAERGGVSVVAANALLSIIGHFPQGFGITYIPKNNKNQDLDRYEYAIVIGLNPVDPFVPTCRRVTRNLTFIANGPSLRIETANNLYFQTAKRKLEHMSPERLAEILSKLSSNFEERMELELIPSYWNPYAYFSYEKLQNLWKLS